MDNSGNSPSSNSPNVAEEQVTEPDSSIPRRTSTISVVGEASQETRLRLQQNSAALDEALNRIRQARRRLLEVTESLPARVSQLNLQRPEPEFRQVADTQSLPPEFQPGGQGDAQAADARARAPWNQALSGSESSSNRSVGIQQMGTTMNVPWSAVRALSVVRASPANRDAQGDDGSTILGRRVAARLAAMPTVGDAASATSQLMQDVEQIYEGTFNSIVSVTRRYEEDLGRLLHAIGQRRRNSTAAPLRLNTSRTPTSAQTPSQGIPQLSPRQSLQGTPRSSHSPPDALTLSSQRDLGSGRSISNGARQNTMPSERFSFLSNFSVQNFPVPSTSESNTPNRPPIFDEPLNYVSSETIDPASESRYHLTPDSAFQGRNYVVHRRYARNGEELVHNITVDWDDDDDTMSLLMPSPNTSRRPRNRFSNSRQSLDNLRASDTITPSPPTLPPPPPPPYPHSEEIIAPFFSSVSSNFIAPSDPPEVSNTRDTAPRRRGWARLDLDGNEIPSDEEEEFERSRADSRMRATRRARILASIAQSTGMPFPATPPPQEVTIYQNIKPPVVLRHDPSLSYPADFVNPLPMPLSEMVESKKSAKRKSILLPPHAIMAGR